MENITYFRNTLNNEIIRLEYLSEKWHENFLNGTVPEEESGNILTVIGQTKLLIKEKFRQFNELIEICEKNDPAMQKVTLQDLQGFWDVVTIEIDKINKDYNVLEEKESKEWKTISQGTEPNQSLHANNTVNLMANINDCLETFSQNPEII